MTAATRSAADKVTRAVFYQRLHGGGLRTARRAFVCGQFGCLKKVQPGEQYFDTMETTTWPATKKICTACSEVEL